MFNKQEGCEEEMREQKGSLVKHGPFDNCASPVEFQLYTNHRLIIVPRKGNTTLRQVRPNTPIWKQANLNALIIFIG